MSGRSVREPAADQAHRAAEAGRVVGGAQRAGAADRFEGVVEAEAAGQALDGVRQLFGRDGLGGAELQGHLAAVGGRVDGNDPRRPGDLGTLEDADADAAESDHDDRRTGFHLGRVEGGADAGGDTAADQGGDLVGDVVRDRDRRVRRDDRLLGERAGCRACRGRSSRRP